MKTIGSHLYALRKKNKRTLVDLESETKIKCDFIRAIEKEKWDTLPEYPVVTGFVKRIAKALNSSPDQAVALLRRDYPPRAISPNPKPDVFSTFSWSPRLTFIVGIIFVFLLILGYLSFQYVDFTKAPQLTIEKPVSEEIVSERFFTVSGVTDPEATIKVNNQPVVVEEDGTFSTQIEIFEGTEEIVVRAESRSGKLTEVRKAIMVDLE